MSNATNSEGETAQPDDEPAQEISSVSEPELTKKQRRLGIFYSSIAFFLGYVVSAGPVVFINDKFDLPMITQIIEILYFPLILIIKLNVPVLAPLIKAWVELFQ